jgi:hypothetical protein
MATTCSIAEAEAELPPDASGNFLGHGPGWSPVDDDEYESLKLMKAELEELDGEGPAPTTSTGTPTTSTGTPKPPSKPGKPKVRLN